MIIAPPDCLPAITGEFRLELLGGTLRFISPCRLVYGTGGTGDINGGTVENGMATGASGMNGSAGADQLGGCFSNAGTVTLINLIVKNCTATGGNGGANTTGPGGAGGFGQGGAIYNTGTLTITNSTFLNNHAIGGAGGDGATSAGGKGGNGAGGAIFDSPSTSGASHLTITGSTFDGNTTVGGNGGASGGPISPTFVGSGYGSGGALDISDLNAVLVLSGNTFSNNSATSPNGRDGTAATGGQGAGAYSGYGGAIYSNGPNEAIVNSTFINNTAQGGNAGADSMNKYSFGGPGYGGAIGYANFSSTLLTLTNDAFSGNRVIAGLPGVGSSGGLSFGIASGGAVDNYAASVTIGNSPFTGNTASGGTQNGRQVTPNSCGQFETFTDAGHNIENAVFPGTCGFTTCTPKFDLFADPLLATTLADNGGPTPTLSLGTGSVAIGWGDGPLCANQAMGVDERGVPRGSMCSSGPFESGLVPSTTTLTANATSIAVGQSVALTAQVQGIKGGAPVNGTVAFRDGGTTIGSCTMQSLTGGNATCTIPSLTLAGSPHSLTAVYAGGTNYLASPVSAVLAVTVGAAPDAKPPPHPNAPPLGAPVVQPNRAPNGGMSGGGTIPNPQPLRH